MPPQPPDSGKEGSTWEGRDKVIQERIFQLGVEKFEQRTPRVLAYGLFPDLRGQDGFHSCPITFLNNSLITLLPH